MDDGQRDFVDFLLSRNSNAAEIEKRFSLLTIVNSINIIKDALNANKEFGAGFGSSNVTTSSDNETATTNGKTVDSVNNTTKSGIPLAKLQSYLDLAKIVSDNEMRYVERFGMNLDMEELLSIGIIAINVLIKNNTPEQLEKYSTIHLAIAITWAIRNELSIRYKKYSQASKSLEFHADNPKSTTRMMVYYVVKDIYHNQGEIADSSVMQEIKDMMESISKAKSKMSGPERECAEYFFSKQSTPAEINEKYSSTQVIEMLDAVKRERKDNNLIQMY